MRHVQVVLAADVFEQIGIGQQRGVLADGPGFRIRFGIVDGKLHVEVPEVAPAIALGQMHGVGMRAARVIEPGARVDADGIDHKSKPPCHLPIE